MLRASEAMREARERGIAAKRSEVEGVMRASEAMRERGFVPEGRAQSAVAERLKPAFRPTGPTAMRGIRPGHSQLVPRRPT